MGAPSRSQVRTGVCLCSGCWVCGYRSGGTGSQIGQGPGVTSIRQCGVRGHVMRLHPGSGSAWSREGHVTPELNWRKSSAPYGSLGLLTVIKVHSMIA
eukprot:1783132-Rhodomonas_salina.1